MTETCADPVNLPGRGMTDQEVEVGWGRDRDALRDCASKHQALVDWAVSPQ